MTRPCLCLFPALLVGGFLAVPVAADELTPASVEFFEKNVRPLLATHCHTCHSAATKHRGNLFLDSRAAVLKGGDTGPALVPGDPDKSLLIKAIGYKDADLRMPPRSKLSDEQIATLTRWVRMGAPWPETSATSGPTGKETFDLKERAKHWSLQPLHAQAPPEVQYKDWARSPIDCFLLSKLEAAGLAPAAPADKRTLLRRVTYDLIGLPPTAAEIDAFLADDSPAAYERVVERLLASPHYGERWGRHWLDLVRFAETLGHEFDFDLPEAYVYRDYVIRAFNDDLPYDQFVREHVAGDLLPKPRLHSIERFNESILGTGFWFFGEARHSPVDVRGDQADHIDNQLDVFGKTFLGLTVACARCHDHKFDAISTRDYYALAGYLQSSRQQRAFIEDPQPRGESLRQLRDLHAQSGALAVSLSAKVLSEQAERLAQVLLNGRLRREDIVERIKTQAARPVEHDPRYVVFEDFDKPGYQGWFATGEAFGEGPSRMADVLLQPKHVSPVQAVVGPGVAHSGLLAPRLQGALRSRTFVIDRNKVLYRVAGHGGRINLIIDGYQLIRDPIYGGLTLAASSGDRWEWRVQDVHMWQGHRAYIEIIDDDSGDIAVDQILLTNDGPPPQEPNRLLLRPLDNPALNTPEALVHAYQELLLEIIEQWRSGALETATDRADRLAVLNWMLQSDLVKGLGNVSAMELAGDERSKWAELLARQKQVEASLPQPRRALALADGTGINERVHIRGSHKILGDEVPRRFLEALAGSEQPAPATGSGRLELAERMLAPSNGLLPRVMVNRIWQHHFGEGLVRSPDNLGVLGQTPTHPELLDFLAAEFVRRGWSVKEMHGLMVLSSAYRMASRSDAHAEELDPQNKLLHRMPLVRLEAEAVRDAIMAVSGRLDGKLYGPGVMPHLTAFMEGRGRPPMSGPLDGSGRRSVYLNVRRNFLTPMFLAFDYPIPFSTMGKRSVSNVPAQALTLMNNPFVLQQAELWAKRVLAEPELTPKQRVAEMYMSAFGRPPTEAEQAEALAFVEEQGKQYGRAGDPRSWTDLGHVLLNVKEFIFIN